MGGVVENLERFEEVRSETQSEERPVLDAEVHPEVHSQEVHSQEVHLDGKIIFGSFWLGDSEFAVSVSHLQEVVNAPAAYTAIPLAPAFLRGLFNLRGSVVPVIDLRDLLKLQGGTQGESPKVAIVELEGACVGLLFDRTGEVFNNDDDERSDFERDSSDSVISGVFKKDDGKRLVQILDVTRLFKLHNVPKDRSRGRLGTDRARKKRGTRQQCISFRVGPACCALPISDIHEIIKVDRVHESALGVGDCIGTIDLRGATVPVIDFAALLKYREVDRSETATQGDRRIVIMRLEKELFGLMVDAIDSIISYFPDELIRFPLVEQYKADMFKGCIAGEGGADVLLLNHEKILTNEEVNEITRGHSELYQTREQASAVDKASKGGARRTYISFRIDNSYAVAINEVREIIEYPEKMLQPPGLREYVDGVLNLRGDLVTIVDARALYLKGAKPELEDSQKVLIFKRNEQDFGLVVDAVESIVTFSEKDKKKLPGMLYRQEDGGISADISEAVEVKDSNGQDISMLILSVDALARRASA